MGDLRFSDAFTKIAMLDNGVSTGGTGGFENANSRFYLMKGTIPDQVAFDAAGANFRSTDRLVTFDTDGKVSTSGRIITLDFVTATASATGTAIWFYWDGGPSSSNAATASRLLGTVSINGGGGDLTMADVNIISGELTGAGQVNLEIPQSYTY